jgi:hypothetical protein
MLYQKISSLYKREEVRPYHILEGIYNEPEVELLKDINWVFTEKVDGTNIRIIWDGHRVTFGGRTENASIPALLGNRLSELFLGETVEQIFEQVFGENPAIIFGEGFGSKIQKGGGNYSSTQEFIVFDVAVSRWYLKREDIEDIAQKFGVQVVPIITTGKLEVGVNLVKNNMKSYWGDFIAEGLVAKPAVELRNRRGERIVVKIKHKDFIV